MGMKHLMVHLDEGERSRARLALAVKLAQRDQARLVGVFGQRAEAHHVGVVATWPSEEYTAAATATRARFEQATAGMADVEWLDINRGGDAELLRRITDVARFSDMMILGQHNEQEKSLVPPDLPEEVVVSSGRPILVVPYVGDFAEVGRRPLIAWNNSREAAHALNDALPLIAGCEEAILLSLDTRYDEAKSSCANAASHLACYDIASRSEVLMVEDVGVMDMLLNRVTDLGADMLVMGAHGQMGFPFVSRGAGTRHILRQMTVPVLMSY